MDFSAALGHVGLRPGASHQVTFGDDLSRAFEERREKLPRPASDRYLAIPLQKQLARWNKPEGAENDLDRTVQGTVGQSRSPPAAMLLTSLRSHAAETRSTELFKS